MGFDEEDLRIPSCLECDEFMHPSASRYYWVCQCGWELLPRVLDPVKPWET